jgi:hypothetical protein
MRAAAVALLSLILAGGCGSDETRSPATPGRDYVVRVDNPWFPLKPGTTLVYRGTEGGEQLRDVFTVTNRTKLIQGARCTVVVDRLYKDGRLAERTTDWYAQDAAGNVWYFGEETAELDENGNVQSTEGTWQAGVDGAKAGIFMPAHPKVGHSFRQEYYKGHAEDRFRVLRLDAAVRVPYAQSDRALLTKEWTPLEPDVVGHKYYVRGIGTVKEQTVKGGDELLVLVEVRKKATSPQKIAACGGSIFRGCPDAAEAAPAKPR